MYAVGIDCGGTYLRIGIVDENGQVIGFTKEASPLREDPKKFGQVAKQALAKIITQKNLQNPKFEGLGIGVPGPLDTDNGLIYPSANLRNKVPIDIFGQFDRQLFPKMAIERDTNCSLIGEYWQGDAQGYSNIAMLTLGTGVGGGIIVNGSLIKGDYAGAGEIGHMYIKCETDDVPVCGRGHKGCLESLVKSTTDLAKIGFYLGVAFANMVALINPDKIIVGGGLLEQGDFLTMASSVMRDKGMKPAVDRVAVIRSQLGDLAGIIGSAKLILHPQS